MQRYLREISIPDNKKDKNLQQINDQTAPHFILTAGREGKYKSFQKMDKKYRRTKEAKKE